MGVHKKTAFDNARMEVFGSQAYLYDPVLLHPDPNGPYGILGSPNVLPHLRLVS